MSKIYELLGMDHPVTGDLGLEIEVEGKNLPRNIIGWHTHNDGSLRGESMEYVFPQPLSIGNTVVALQRLNDAIKQNGAKILETGRAGVHVHVNVNELTMDELMKMLTLFIVFEEPLVHWCGKSREGNMFCLRSFDAEELIKALIDLAKVRNLNPIRDFNRHNNRYSSVNLASVTKFGSLEFRTMRSTTDTKVLLAWCEMLLALRNAACKEFSTPQDVVLTFSAIGAGEMMRKVFGKRAKELDMMGLEESIWRGVRRAQHFAFIEPTPKKPRARKKPEVEPDDVLEQALGVLRHDDQDEVDL